MGFAYNTPITVDADFAGIAQEQQITNLLRGVGATWTTAHEEAVNAIILRLKGKGFDPATVTNTQDFRREAIYWILQAIFEAQAREGGQNAGRAQGKAAYYKQKYLDEVKASVIETATKIRPTRQLPKVANIDYGWRLGTGSPQGDGNPQLGRGKVPNFDKYVQDNPQ